MSTYKDSLQKDKLIAKEYYKKSIFKTQQHLFLEYLLINQYKDSVDKIGDIACGGGTLSYHLKELYPNSFFSLIDFNDDALKLAEELNGKERFTYTNDDIYTLGKIADSSFDRVFCWQTLSWLDNPEKALDSLIRITKKGGSIFLSSLFNLDFDVDIYSKVFDYTRESAKEGLYLSYNTYSKSSISKWLEGKVASFNLFEFNPSEDIVRDSNNRGLGTFTINTEVGRRLQISGGYLMNWAILVIRK